MKKGISLLLVSIMLVAILPANITAQAEMVTKKPFYTVNFSSIDSDTQSELTYVYDMPATWFNQNNIQDSTKEISILFSTYNTNDHKLAAVMMKEDFDAQPEGTRHLSLNGMTGVFFGSVKDVVDMERGVALVKAWLDKFLAEYKSIGGKLDGLSIDLEYNGAYVYYIGTEQYDKGNTEIYKQIAANPVYLKRIRPKLVERGFIFYTNPDSAKYPERSELWTLHRKTGEGGNATSQSIWNQTIQELLAEYINEATYAPLMKYYPDAILSDYKTGDSAVWYKGMDHMGGQAGYSTVKAGNTSNYNAYDYTPGSLFFGYASEKNRSKRTKYLKPASHNEAVFADAPFSRTLWGVNDHKRMLASTDTGKMNSWITFFNYGTSGTGYSNTPYYSEMLYHIGMTNPEPFLGYIIKNEVLSKGYDDPDPNVCEYDYNLKVVDQIMQELTRVAGYSDRRSIITPIAWNDGYILSGMYANGRNIWRLTPDTGKVSKEDFKIKGDEPAFSAGGVTITFPKGKIIEDSKILQVGSCGYWIETPADVTPVVTSTADRYAKNPSFQDTFDTYQTGVFTADSVLPDTYWTVSGSAVIKDNGGNKALALTGNVTLTNTKVPEKITAGDDYAKQQVWQIKVTLPSGDYGSVRLLSRSENDGGFKLSGGKVYYDQSGSYKEMDGVSLSAGTYTLERVLDFQTDGRYKCSYYIYGADGKLLGSAENVAIHAGTLPVSAVSVFTVGTKDTILLDDYKLYPTGVTTALDLYNAELGRKVTDPSGEQTADTAYRLSWMNASEQHKVARVYDAKTGTILKKVEMAPGMDGVVTGVVEADGNKAVQILVDVQDGTSLQPDNNNNTGGTNDGVGEEGGSIYDIIEGTTPDATNAANPDDTGGNNTTAPGEDKGMGGGAIALIVILSIAVLTGGALAVYLLVIKPKHTKTKASDRVDNDE